MFDNTLESRRKIERLEKNYLDNISFLMQSDIEKLIVGLNSKDSIREEWIHFLNSNEDKRMSELSRGAERIFSWLFNQFGVPNSSPIGADMFFETHDAFIHIDVKSAQTNNGRDVNGQLTVEKSQTSYRGNVIPTRGKNKGQVRPYSGNLPVYYTKSNGKRKICLTYFIAILYNAETLDIEWIKVVCMPNGLLYNTYGDTILAPGKATTEVRYRYRNNGTFNLIEDNPSRVNVLYWNPNMTQDIANMFTDLRDIYNNGEEF